MNYLVMAYLDVFRPEALDAAIARHMAPGMWRLLDER